MLFYYQQFALGNRDPIFIKDYIAVEALIAGVNPQMLQGIAKEESHFNCNAIGDHGDSIGCFQINKPTQKKTRPLTVEQAKNPIIATLWSIQTIKEDGDCHQWSTCKKVMLSIRDD